MNTVERVGDGVVRATDGLVNFCVVADDHGALLVDAGLPRHWGLLEQALSLVGLGVGDLRAVLLTHGHADHTGIARRLQQQLGIDVYVHEQERQLLLHPLRGLERERSPLRYLTNLSANRALAQMVLGGALGASTIERFTPIAGGDRFEALPGAPAILQTPGHTRGHCSVFFAQRDVLVCGDALVTYDPYSGERGPRLIARAATWSSAAARDSLAEIEASAAGVLVPGHGDPWTEGAAEAVRLARAAHHA